MGTDIHQIIWGNDLSLLWNSISVPSCKWIWIWQGLFLALRKKCHCKSPLKGPPWPEQKCYFSTSHRRKKHFQSHKKKQNTALSSAVKVNGKDIRKMLVFPWCLHGPFRSHLSQLKQRINMWMSLKLLIRAQEWYLCYISTPPENIRKPYGFLMFSRGIEK